MDPPDTVDPSVGLFNGVRIALSFYNESTEQWLLELSLMGLTAPAEAYSLRFIAELIDAGGNVLSSAPFDVTTP